MDADARALYDFGRIVVFGVGFALALLAYQLSRAITAGLDFNIPFVGRPFHGIAVALEHSIVRWTQDAYKGAEAEVTAGLNGLIDDLAVWLGLVLLLGLGVKAAFEYLWNSALAPRIESAVSKVRTVAQSAFAKVEALPAQIDRDVGRAEHYADGVASRAFDRATVYADGLVTRTVAALRGEFGAGMAALRAAEDAALTRAMQIAANGIHAAEEAAATAETEAEAFAASRVAKVEAFAATAVADVRGLAEGVGTDLEKLQQYIDSLGLAGLVATVPALAVLVNALVSETGLENAECRSKVKGICGANPSRWAGLLAGLAAVGLAFDFRALVRLAEDVAVPAEALIRKAA